MTSPRERIIDHIEKARALAEQENAEMLSYMLDMAASEARRVDKCEEGQPAPANVATTSALLDPLPDERL